MKVVKQYKTFNKETGEIRMDVRLISTITYDFDADEIFQVISNKDVICESNHIEEMLDYYEKLKQMDYYIASKLDYYEVYTIVY